MKIMVKCEYCQKEFKHARGFHVHEMNCIRKLASSEKKSMQRETASDSNRGCEHSFRLLNRESNVENHAYLNHFREVCNKCQELR